MIPLLNYVPQWPSYLLLASVFVLAIAAMRVSFKMRSLDKQLTLSRFELEQLAIQSNNIARENEKLEGVSAEHESLIEQLRQQNIEYRVRGEERERHSKHDSQLSEAREQALAELTGRYSRLLAELAEVKMAADKDRLHQQEKLELFEQSRSQLKQELQLLANNILENNAMKLAANNESQLKQVLQPVREQLQSFHKKVEDVYEKESQQRFSLIGEINKLQSLNERISEDAIALTNALKGENKTAGNWGEVVLERLLEASGLVKGREFEVQSSRSDSQGRRMQPDVIVSLPHKKSVVIDAKVSLVAYEKLYNSESQEQSEQAVREHLASIRQHIKGLSKKQYDQLEGLRTLDFVLLFIPVEGAYISAIQQDIGLLTESYQQNVVLVSPSTLLSTLRVIHNLWRQEHQNQNALEIARQAGNLYDKFANFGQDLLIIGQRLEQSQNAYQQAMDRLCGGRGNLLARVEKLKILGARTSKQIPAELVTKESDSEQGTVESRDSGN